MIQVIKILAELDTCTPKHNNCQDEGGGLKKRPSLKFRGNLYTNLSPCPLSLVLPLQHKQHHTKAITLAHPQVYE